MSRSKTAWMWFSAMLLTAIASVWLKPQLDPTVQIRAAEPLEDLFPSAFGDWALDPSAVAPIRPAFDVARRFQMYDQVSCFERYCPSVSLVLKGPRNSAVINVVVIRAGHILKNLAMANDAGLFFVSRLLVTTRPLRKKNIFTASDPE